MKKLLIISHTGHQKTKSGEIVGWGPTINELNFLAGEWNEIVHIACLEDTPPKGSSLPYKSPNIRFVPIPTFGGQKISQKTDVIWKTPGILKIVKEELQGTSAVQLRLPMGIGVFLLPFFALHYKRPYTLWVKYANNWGATSPPLGYRLQRWFLKRNFTRCKVTINGFWPNQEPHCLSFENPCLHEGDIASYAAVAQTKTHNPPFHLVFIGRLETEKGIHELLDALDQYKRESLQFIGHIDFVGAGPLEAEIKTRLTSSISYTLHGFLPKEAVFKILEFAHFLVLPSHSEGFPKVIAEAAAFGVIPVVSDVGSIPHYIYHEKNGFIWALGASNPFTAVLQQALTTRYDKLSIMKNNLLQLAHKFTFERYAIRIEQEVLNPSAND